MRLGGATHFWRSENERFWFGSNPVALIFFQGLSHFQSESYVADPAVQKRDFDHSTLCRVFQAILSRRINTK
jgi:hypothetical protein